ncbi:MAG: hypothetical protein M3125_02620, partial [Gemmatimonadota bacterium]|nr:hypothetical protein [Gemmatimonadota bacterium]
LVVALSTTETEQALNGVLAERGFERVELTPPSAPATVARSEARFFDVDALEPALSIVREWPNYSDATPWGAALDLAEGLPAAARMEMALPPALSVLARALSRGATVLGFASREKPRHLVSVAFRGGRAVDVFAVVKDRVVAGSSGQPERSSPEQARTRLREWAEPYLLSEAAFAILLGERDLVSGWRFAYLHRD